MTRFPDFSTLNRIEEEALVARLKAIRNSITHAGEKGRACEQAISGLLRRLLPAEYGLSTGFVAWLSPTGVQMSQQLDIIIFDAIRSGPLIHLDACNVFPLEAVYAYVEVKASLRASDAVKIPHDSIEGCVLRNLELRRMDTRMYYVPQGGSPALLKPLTIPWLSLRSFIVAFEAEGLAANDLPTLAARLRSAQVRAGSPAHLHGVFIPEHGLLSTRAVNASIAEPSDYFHVRSVGDDALSHFRTLLLHSLATFQRPEQNWIPALDKYFSPVSQWHDEIPEE
jgi:hypothetical protein